MLFLPAVARFYSPLHGDAAQIGRSPVRDEATHWAYASPVEPAPALVNPSAGRVSPAFLESPDLSVRRWTLAVSTAPSRGPELNCLFRWAWFLAILPPPVAKG